ncbi:Zinc finger DNA binding protein, partial [Operophtera brumata]
MDSLDSLNVESPLCLACRSITADDDFMTCMQCRLSYHFLCLGMAETVYKGFSASQKETWMCHNCSGHMRKRGSYIDTPVRSSLPNDKPDMVLASEISGSTSPSWVTQRQRSGRNINVSEIVIQGEHKHDCLTKEDIIEVIRMEMRNSLKHDLRQIICDTISSELREIKSEITTLKNEVTSFRETMNFISQSYESLKIDLGKKADVISELKGNLKALEYTNEVVGDRLAQMEQHSRGTNIEIQCVPEQSSENLILVVQQLAKSVSFELQDSDIHLCTRTAKMDPSSLRPRSIIVKLNSPRTRDGFLAATLNFNKKNPTKKLNSNHLGISGTSIPVFVGEHLSPRNKELHRAARLKAKEKDYKYVWVRGGRIFVRKTERDQATVIKDFNQGGGGVMIAINKKISSYRAFEHESDTFEDLWVVIETSNVQKSTKFCVCAIYTPPPVKLAGLQRVVDGISENLDQYSDSLVL